MKIPAVAGPEKPDAGARREAGRIIRSGDSGALNPEVPIVALTANAFQSNVDACTRWPG